MTFARVKVAVNYILLWAYIEFGTSQELEQTLLLVIDSELQIKQYSLYNFCKWKKDFYIN